jgi:hypothetical protein
MVPPRSLYLITGPDFSENRLIGRVQVRDQWTKLKRILIHRNGDGEPGWSLRLIAFGVGYLIVGSIVGRSLWRFIENNIPAEAFRLAYNSVAESLGLVAVTSLDSRMIAIERVVDFLSLPWALLGGLICVFLLEWLMQIYFQRSKGN